MKYTCIEDLRIAAKKRVPKMFYDYVDSGSWTEGTYRANTSDFDLIKLRQRVGVDVVRGRNPGPVSVFVGRRRCRAEREGDSRSQCYQFSHRNIPPFDE